ncbi:DHA2 family efflux MFS transporter permease subunit [Nocardioides sp. MAH-18]|uniref:DHA2 family efflux MFS transporter permease subunit n=1 Tax=Nocardioides agri TaxID=2682843 RepID=A0A6L6XQX2_9ACTN|nr:DHA2 family efflux MFS transporter permease subunit [Nocardioides sp. CGMCC 1.13656]MBA2954684.1 DHA2 family efflux MFS transporter permease subunit [Nocardioides sp. CGMCC 1.13656]MVQ49540.1 DHA2 family efflux MFS transporter permease subunit [Nocardioides sp. MAH-18]
MTDTHTPAAPAPVSDKRPWPALFALCLGFFMILVDMTIVQVAVPAIITDLDADVNSVVWVSSAYLLAYAVPVLITGRLGDRFGPRRLYLTGLTVFTLASLWCGLTGTIEMLILARTVQGLGAALMTPQTMAIITRIFPAAERGKAMALWGATSGVSMVVGPLLGGVLVDGLGWEWIFFVNVPVGIVGFVLAMRLVPVLETHQHSFDWLGVALSGVGMFLLVFGIQEGHQQDWAGWIIAMIVSGLVVLGLFVLWQARNSREPLVPLSLFKDRNFSVGNIAISVMGFSLTAIGFPLMIYAQAVRGYTPTEAAALLVPMAIMVILLARPVGRLTDSVHPRVIVGTGFAAIATSFFWLASQMTPDSAVWQLVLPMILMGVGNACIWAPVSATAMRNLPLTQAGAGSGVYNATRQVGGVLGSAAIAVLMDSRLAHFGLSGATNPEAGGGGTMPAQVADEFAKAMAQSLLLPAVVLLLGLAASLCFERPRHTGFPAAAAAAPE